MKMDLLLRINCRRIVASDLQCISNAMRCGVIVKQAHGFAPVSISIPVSVDVAKDGVMSVAR